MTKLLPVGSIFIFVQKRPPSELESELLFNLDFVCLFGSRQPMRNRRLTLEKYLQLPHPGEDHQAMKAMYVTPLRLTALC